MYYIVEISHGDVVNTVGFERISRKLIDSMFSLGKATPSIFSSVQEKNNTVTAYYSTSGYDVCLVFEKTNEDSVTGFMMYMFDA